MFRVQSRNRPDRNSTWPGIGSTDSTADRLPLSGSQRINIRWKAETLRFPRPKTQEPASGFWTNDHNRALFLVQLLSQGLREIRGMVAETRTRRQQMDDQGGADGKHSPPQRYRAARLVALSLTPHQPVATPGREAILQEGRPSSHL